jgi:hypothetical protein
MGRSQNRAALQPFLHQFPTLTNREMFWANRVFSGRNREFRRYSVRRPVLPRLPIIGGPCGPKVASGPLALRPPHPVSHCAIPGETARGRADRGPDLRFQSSHADGDVDSCWTSSSQVRRLSGRPIFNDATIPAWMRCMLCYPSSSDSERCFGQRRRHFADADVPASSISFQEEPSNFAMRSDS